MPKFQKNEVKMYLSEKEQEDQNSNTRLLSKLFDFNNIMILGLYTPCPQKKLEVWFLAISQLLFGQIQKVRSVLKTIDSENFKTVLTFDIWPSRSWENWGKRHHGSFSFFTWICKKLSNFSSCNCCFGPSKPPLDILHYFF